MQSTSQQPLPSVARYYDERVREFGATPWGVDWTCELTQQLRFVKLLEVAGKRRRFSLNDLGCGYGALLPFVQDRYGPDAVDYIGADIAPTMIAQANALHGGRARFVASAALPRVADFSVASGLFNVQLGFSQKVWRGFVEDVLAELHRASRHGFAANFVLPPQAGIEEPLQGLYRTDPAPWIDFCSRAFGADVRVLRGYGLREFTLLARRPSPRTRA